MMRNRFSRFATRRSRPTAFAGCCLLACLPAYGQREAEDLSAGIRRATARVTPAAVSIRPLGIVPRVPGTEFIPPLALPPLVRFGALPVPRARIERMPSGSGLIVDARRGLAATTGRVLRGSMQAEIVLPDGAIRPAIRIMAADPGTDLVLIEFDRKGIDLVQVEWADSRTLQLGEWVVAVGRSAMGKPLASAGIISASVDPTDAGSELDPIQTDALVTAETAGGPLVNLEGQVVGISQLRGDFVGGDPRDAFRTAIPEILVRKVAGEFLTDGGKARRGYLGVTLGSGRRSERTVVATVSPGSPAEEAGLAPGDRILAIDGRSVRDAQGLARAVELAPIGQEMTLIVERGGKKFEARFHTKPRPEVPGSVPVESQPAPDPLDEPRLDPLPRPSEGTRPEGKLPPALPEGPLPELESP